MSIHADSTVRFGDFVAAMFDEAARHSTLP